MFHSVRKSQEYEIGMFIAYKNRECGIIYMVDIVDDITEE
jgi:hypothetical protein